MSQRGGRHQRRPSQSVAFSIDFTADEFGASGAAAEQAAPPAAPPMPPTAKSQNPTPPPPTPSPAPVDAGRSGSNGSGALPMQEQEVVAGRSWKFSSEDIRCSFLSATFRWGKYQDIVCWCCFGSRHLSESQKLSIQLSGWWVLSPSSLNALSSTLTLSLHPFARSPLNWIERRSPHSSSYRRGGSISPSALLLLLDTSMPSNLSLKKTESCKSIRIPGDPTTSNSTVPLIG